MASKLTAAADAIAAALNAAPDGTFEQAFTAVRVWQPAWTIEDLATLRLTVVPAAYVPTWVTKSHVISELTIDVGVHFKLPPGTQPDTEAANAVIDPLVELIERVSEFFKPGTDLGGAKFVSAATDVVCDPQQLRRDGVFFAFAALELKR